LSFSLSLAGTLEFTIGFGSFGGYFCLSAV
jgi:hypothetical protein